MSFMSVQKYPSVASISAGDSWNRLLLFALFDRLAATDLLKPFRNFLNVYGRVPFFFVHSSHLSGACARTCRNCQRFTEIGVSGSPLRSTFRVIWKAGAIPCRVSICFG